MAFTVSLKKISKSVLFSAFYISLLYSPDIHASQSSDEEIKEPVKKKRKLIKSSDSDIEIIHIVDPLTPKPNPIASNTNTSILPELSTSTSITFVPSAAPKKKMITDFFKPESSKPLVVEEKVVGAESKPLKDSFYIFNVGQGNSQLASYIEGPGKPFAVLYDCGTSAETVNSKVLKVQRYNKETQPFLIRKLGNKVTSSTANQPFDNIDEEETVSSNEDKGSPGVSSQGSNRSFSNDAETESSKAPIIKDIKDTLKNFDNLFVVLSHPDKDHINLIKDAVPPNKNVLFILCGNFFAENDKDDLKKDISELFSFIADRRTSHPTRTHFTLPYFWPSEHRTSYSSLKYEDIKNFLSTYPTTKKLPLGIDTYLPKGFQGNLKTFLQKMQQLEPQENDNSNSLPFYTNYANDGRLEDIYIWHMNQISDNINNHSPVISFRMPYLEKTFVCTGDAGPEVFLKIQKKVSKQMASQSVNPSSSISPLLENKITLTAEEQMRTVVDTQLYGKGLEPYIVMLMLPHHGAEKNLSYSMLDLFAPHILGISAGAGSMYRHPSTDLIKLYKIAYKIKAHLQVRKTQLWENYDTGVVHYYLTFKDDKKTDEDKKSYVHARLNILKNTSLPIVSTGIAGTINVTKNNFYGQFIDHFEFNDQVYSLEFAEAICVNDFDTSKVENKNVKIVKKGQSVSIAPSTEDITYKGIIFEKTESNKWSERNFFLSKDEAQLLVSLDIKYKGANNIIQKFYLGHKVMTDN